MDKRQGPFTLYYVNERNKPICPINEIFSEDRSVVEGRLRHLWANELLEIRSMEINEKCRCADYTQTTMVLLKVDDPDNIELIGSDNFKGIYKKIDVPLGVDIESYTKGRYTLMSLDYFMSHYSISAR